jgi:membrane-associated protein
MIESLASWLSVHADQAPLWIFFLLLLTGFSLPISEDVMVIVSGVLAGSVLPEKKEALFLAAFFGAYFSDWIAYWIGRMVGNRISKKLWLAKTFSEERMRVIEAFFVRYGFLTLFVGRFIPFGVRNSIFMAAGAGKMHFGRFILSDGVSCFLFSLIVFSLAVQCGENYDSVCSFTTSVGYIAGFFAMIGVGSIFLWNRFLRGRSKA